MKKKHTQKKETIDIFVTLSISVLLSKHIETTKRKINCNRKIESLYEGFPSSGIKEKKNTSSSIESLSVCK